MTDSTLLAIAAASNGMLLTSDMLERGADLRAILIGHMEDYFRTTPSESSQFDAATVLGEVQAVSEDEVPRLLTAIGFRATPAQPGTFTLEPRLWEEFLAEHSR